jgi:hypothetical protein
VLLVVVRVNSLSPVGRGLAVAGWLLLLGSLGAAFSAQGRLNGAVTESSTPIDAGAGGTLALWLLIAGLAVSAMAMLF